MTEQEERMFNEAYRAAGQRVEDGAPIDRPFMGAEEFWGNTIKQMESWKRAFAERQEPLGPDFERILSDNLWDLYQRCSV